MPRKYDENTKTRAVRLVVDHAEDYDSEWEAVKTVSGRLGMHPETLRKWLRQAEVDAGVVDGVTTMAARELRELKRKERRVGTHHQDSQGGEEFLRAATTSTRACS